MAGALALVTTEVRADLLPEPRRPREWEDARPPMPDPPPEKELPTLPLALLLAVAAATAAAIGLRRPAVQTCG